MFGVLTDAIENALAVGTGIMTGDLPSKRQVARLIDDGLSVVAVAALFGVGVEVVESLLEE